MYIKLYIHREGLKLLMGISDGRKMAKEAGEKERISRLRRFSRWFMQTTRERLDSVRCLAQNIKVSLTEDPERISREIDKKPLPREIVYGQFRKNKKGPMVIPLKRK